MRGLWHPQAALGKVRSPIVGRHRCDGSHRCHTPATGGRTDLISRARRAGVPRVNALRQPDSPCAIGGSAERSNHRCITKRVAVAPEVVAVLPSRLTDGALAWDRGGRDARPAVSVYVELRRTGTSAIVPPRLHRRRPLRLRFHIRRHCPIRRRSKQHPNDLSICATMPPNASKSGPTARWPDDCRSSVSHFAPPDARRGDARVRDTGGASL
jgi:hypothetical protein